MIKIVPHRQVVAQQNTLYVDEVDGKALVEIETKKLNRLVRTLEELVSDDLPVITFSVISNLNYLLTVFVQDDNEVSYIVTTAR